MDFKNKVIIITGASVGIGETTALKLASYSAKLVLVARNEEKLKQVASKIEKCKAIKPLIVKADLEKDEDVIKIVEKTIECFGKIDVLINNAGAGVIAGLKDGIRPYDKMMTLNIRCPYFLTSLASPYLIKSKGNVVNISSVASTKAMINFMSYCISKAALDMFTKCAAKELAMHGVRVNSVNPGPTVSEFHDRLGLGPKETENLMKERAEESPLKKIAKTEEVADLVMYLASDMACSITGSVYVIDNGFLLP